MYWKVIMFLLLSSQLLAQQKITGIITDEVSGKPLNVIITMRNKDGRTTSYTSASDGRYQFTLAAGIDTIFYKKAGYRTNFIAIGTPDPQKEVLSIDIKLLPTDKQALNAIYQQSEQTHTVVEKSTGKTAGQTFVISAVDAVSGQSLPADFALFATSSKKKMTYNTTAQKQSFEVTFAEKDIIALEVSAQGYDDYKGNLIIKSFGLRKSNTIKLIRGQNVLNVSIAGLESSPPASVQCFLVNDTGAKFTLRPADSGRTYSGSIKQTGPASIEIYLAGKLIYSEKIQLNNGLNDKRILVGTNRQADATIPPVDTVIYFNQSTPELRADAKQVLDLIAAQLNLHQKLNLRLIGHTDNVGAQNLNMTLSEYRVKTTRQYLIQRGISERRILTAWKGGNAPVMPNDQEQNKQKNRRVQLIFEGAN